MSVCRLVCLLGLLCLAGCAGVPTGPSTVASGAVVDATASMATSGLPLLVTPPGALGVTRLAAFGDSITYGTLSAFDPRKVYDTTSAPYPERLRALLNSAHGPQQYTVFNEGVPGELAVNALSRFRAMLASRRPHAVLLLEGINDLTNEISISRIGTSLSQMIDAATATGAPVLIATMYQTYEVTRPDGEVRDNAADMVPALNAEIRRIASGRLNVYVVNLESAIRDRALVGNDGLHPSEEGFAAMAARFLAVIEANFAVKGSFH
jgi:lysophospholipase L1-like esterase